MMDQVSSLWQSTDAARGEEYDARWAPLLEDGQNIHGEADLVESLLAEMDGRTVLDAGCGTGRVSIELARRGYAVTGVDADPAIFVDYLSLVLMLITSLIGGIICIFAIPYIKITWLLIF